VRVIQIVRIAVAQARASPRLHSQKMQHADVGGVGAEVHAQRVGALRRSSGVTRHLQRQAAGRCARMLLEVEDVGQGLPAAVEIFVEGALFRFFGGEGGDGGEQLVVQLQDVCGCACVRESQQQGGTVVQYIGWD